MVTYFVSNKKQAALLIKLVKGIIRLWLGRYILVQPIRKSCKFAEDVYDTVDSLGKSLIAAILILYLANQNKQYIYCPANPEAAIWPACTIPWTHWASH
jgi:hypothetical protein